MTDIQQARKWAKKYQRHHVIGPEDEVAAVEVIQSLPDQIIDAEEVREIYDRYRASEITLHEAFRAAVALTTPPLPTLADMTPEERERCQWMQCSHTLASDYENGVIIKPLPDDVTAQVLLPNGALVYIPHRSVVPLPELPRLEWPAQEPQPVVKTLHTGEDYEAAAIGTVVRRQELPWLAATFHKCVDGIWNSTGGHEYPPSEMAGTARTVLWEPKP